MGPGYESTLSPSSRDQDPSSGRGTVRLLLLITAACLSLVGARMFGLSLPHAKKTPFDPSRLYKIVIEKPHYVFIGNSHLGSRLDRRLLAQSIAPKRASMISVGGIHSAHWYLHFKNDVIPAKVAPERVIFFFRGSTLTQPHDRGRSNRSEYDKYALDYEPVLNEILSGRPATPRDDFKSWASNVVPISRFRRTATRAIQSIGLQISNLAVPFSAARGTATPGSNRTAEVNALFNVDELREFSADDDERTAAIPDTTKGFDAAVERSFLPEIIRLAAIHDIELFFVRIKERGHIDVAEETPEARVYFSKLAAYLDAAGAGYKNMRGETWARRSWYRDNVHINRKMRAAYTRSFLTHVPEVFE